jgi:hypothetical protein
LVGGGCLSIIRKSFEENFHKIYNYFNDDKEWGRQDSRGSAMGEDHVADCSITNALSNHNNINSAPIAIAVEPLILEAPISSSGISMTLPTSPTSPTSISPLPLREDQHQQQRHPSFKMPKGWRVSISASSIKSVASGDSGYLSGV